MHAEPVQQHQWLQKLVGDWTTEMECDMGPDQPKGTFTGTETVTSLGGLWTLGEGKPSGGTATTLMTLGYDPKQNCFVGSFIGSMMTNMWVYRGSLDADEKVLTLDTEGPNFTQTGTAKYKDIMTIVSDDHRVLTSECQLEDGTWKQIMTAHYRRQK